MPTQLQIRRGTSTEHNSFTGAAGELTVDTTKDTVVVHDGSTAGGFPLARADGSNFAITNNVTFSDSAKAIFGTGGDGLEIYHDGNNSYIKDSGTGDLLIEGSDNIWLMKAGGSEVFLNTADDGAVTLYHNGASRIATTSGGADVTGSVTADGLTLDSGTATPIVSLSRSGTYSGISFHQTISNVTGAGADLASYSTNNNTGFYWQTTNGSGTTANALVLDPDQNVSIPNGNLDVTGNITQGNGDLLYSGGGNWDIAHTIASQNLVLKTTPSGGSATQRMRISHNGDINFYEDTGATPKLFWDASAESLGIGDTDPANGNLTIRAASTTGTKNGHIMLTGDSSTVGQGPQIAFSESGSGSNWVGGTIGFTRTGGSGIGDLLFSTRQSSGDANTTATEVLRLKSNGEASFANDILLGDAKVARFGNDQDFRISFDGHGIIQNVTSDSDILFKGKDGSTSITALTLDMSNAGAGTFNSSVTSAGLHSTTAGTANFIAGVNAGNSIVSGGNYNTVVGDEAGTAISTGDYNTAVGYSSGIAVDTGTHNQLFGAFSGDNLTTGTNNTALGYHALGTEDTGRKNVAVGHEALKTQNADVDNLNTAVGYQAGKEITTGTNNTFVGSSAGDSITTGSKNTILGRYNGNQGGLDIRTSSNHIVLSDGDGNPRGIFDSSGRFLVNTASKYSVSQMTLEYDSGTEFGLALRDSGSAGAATMSTFVKGGSVVGTISSTSSATAYNTSSDHRLKENVVYDWDATTRLKQLKPARFNFIADDTTVDGFLAHEAQAVVPEAVTGTHNEVDDDGVAVMQGIDQSKLVPLLVKAIQEQQALIESLTARIETLEG